MWPGVLINRLSLINSLLIYIFKLLIYYQPYKKLTLIFSRVKINVTKFVNLFASAFVPHTIGDKAYTFVISLL
jgi:hypothetical protein